MNEMCVIDSKVSQSKNIIVKNCNFISTALIESFK